MINLVPYLDRQLWVGQRRSVNLDIGTQCVHVFLGISGLFRGKHRRPINKEVTRGAKNTRKKRREPPFYACYRG